MRLPNSVVRLLDELVAHEKEQIAAKGLAGTSSRTAVLEALIRMRAKQVGLLFDDTAAASERTASTSRSSRTEDANHAPSKSKKKTSKRTAWSRIRKPEL
ncbi:MAG: hypothetical protein KF795_00640 [Labilithrix sp.]|nr:hypothetical protein [Labilithrix sp.]